MDKRAEDGHPNLNMATANDEEPSTSGDIIMGSSLSSGKNSAMCVGSLENDGGDREEIVKLWKQMDEKLEDKAKSHNLSAVNVKTILHHLIKNPGVISLIMGIDDNASLPHLKLTRSKVKQLCNNKNNNNKGMEPNLVNSSHNNWNENEVVVVPRAERTFLDVDYGHNEDDDDDYNPELDEAALGSDAELDEAEATLDDCSNRTLQAIDGSDVDRDQPALHTRSKYQNPSTDAAMPSTSALPMDDDALLFGDDVLLYSAIDDPDYMDFITTLNDPTRYDVVDESEDDPEYNFMCDLECEQTPERDELRMDRGTEIPMREVENLLQDLIDSGLTSSNNHNYGNNTNSHFTETTTQENCNQNAHHNESTATLQYSNQESKGDHEAAYSGGDHLPQSTSKTSKRHKHPLEQHQIFTDHITVLMNATSEDLQKISLQSASLDDTPTGKQPQFTSSELEQLQIQMTKHVQLLTQFMVGCHFDESLFDLRNEYQKMINDLYEHSSNQPSTSIFANIKNLEASIITCHDAVNCETVLFPQLEEARYKKLNVPLAQTMLVLGRSNALLYPELMPTVRLRAHPSYYQYFTAAEECLLAMGQYMFSHVPHSTSSKRDGRNTLIVRYFLPNKQVSQIRLHMKNFRFSHEPIYTIIARAEQGMVTMIFPPEKADTAQSTVPYMWPEKVQPRWLQMLNKDTFCRSTVVSSDALTVPLNLLKTLSSSPSSTSNFDITIRPLPKTGDLSPEQLSSNDLDGLIIRRLPRSGDSTPTRQSPSQFESCCDRDRNVDMDNSANLKDPKRNLEQSQKETDSESGENIDGNTSRSLSKETNVLISSDTPKSDCTGQQISERKRKSSLETFGEHIIVPTKRPSKVVRIREGHVVSEETLQEDIGDVQRSEQDRLIKESSDHSKEMLISIDQQVNCIINSAVECGTNGNTKRLSDTKTQLLRVDQDIGSDKIVEETTKRKTKIVCDKSYSEKTSTLMALDQHTSELTFNSTPQLSISDNSSNTNTNNSNNANNTPTTATNCNGQSKGDGVSHVEQVFNPIEAANCAASYIDVSSPVSSSLSTGSTPCQFIVLPVVPNCQIFVVTQPTTNGASQQPITLSAPTLTVETPIQVPSEMHFQNQSTSLIQVPVQTEIPSQVAINQPSILINESVKMNNNDSLSLKTITTVNNQITTSATVISMPTSISTANITQQANSLHNLSVETNSISQNELVAALSSVPRHFQIANQNLSDHIMENHLVEKSSNEDGSFHDKPTTSSTSEYYEGHGKSSSEAKPGAESSVSDTLPLSKCSQSITKTDACDKARPAENLENSIDNSSNENPGNASQRSSISEEVNNTATVNAPNPSEVSQDPTSFSVLEHMPDIESNRNHHTNHRHSQRLHHDHNDNNDNHCRSPLQKSHQLTSSASFCSSIMMTGSDNYPVTPQKQHSSSLFNSVSPSKTFSSPHLLNITLSPDSDIDYVSDSHQYSDSIISPPRVSPSKFVFSPPRQSSPLEQSRSRYSSSSSEDHEDSNSGLTVLFTNTSRENSDRSSPRAVIENSNNCNDNDIDDSISNNINDNRNWAANSLTTNNQQQCPHDSDDDNENDSDKGKNERNNDSDKNHMDHTPTPPPRTPDWHSSSHYLSFIDDSASKTRFTDGEGSQAPWLYDGWTPKTPGQPVKSITENEQRNANRKTKVAKKLFTDFDDSVVDDNDDDERNITVPPNENQQRSSPSLYHTSASSNESDIIHQSPSQTKTATAEITTQSLSTKHQLDNSTIRSSPQYETTQSVFSNNENVEMDSTLMRTASTSKNTHQTNDNTTINNNNNNTDQISGNTSELLNDNRNKKRKRKERLIDGLRGMLNSSHRAKQMRAMSGVIMDDFKQKLFMHQHKIHSIQQLITAQQPSTQMFEKLQEILGNEHESLLILVSFLFPQHLLPEQFIANPMRKVYANALEMILNIEAYATFGGSKFTARSIFRSIRELGPFCRSDELERRLYELIGSEHPLWNALSAHLPTATHQQIHQNYEYESVDMQEWSEGDAQWEHVDVSCIRKSDADKKRKPAVINNGKLHVEKKGKVYEASVCYKCEECPATTNDDVIMVSDHLKMLSQPQMDDDEEVFDEKDSNENDNDNDYGNANENSNENETTSTHSCCNTHSERNKFDGRRTQMNVSDVLNKSDDSEKEIRILGISDQIGDSDQLTTDHVDSVAVAKLLSPDVMVNTATSTSSQSITEARQSTFNEETNYAQAVKMKSKFPTSVSSSLSSRDNSNSYNRVLHEILTADKEVIIKVAEDRFASDHGSRIDNDNDHHRTSRHHERAKVQAESSSHRRCSNETRRILADVSGRRKSEPTVSSSSSLRKHLNRDDQPKVRSTGTKSADDYSDRNKPSSTCSNKRSYGHSHHQSQRDRTRKSLSSRLQTSISVKDSDDHHRYRRDYHCHGTSSHNAKSVMYTKSMREYRKLNRISSHRSTSSRFERGNDRDRLRGERSQRSIRDWLLSRRDDEPDNRTRGSADRWRIHTTGDGHDIRSSSSKQCEKHETVRDQICGKKRKLTESVSCPAGSVSDHNRNFVRKLSAGNQRNETEELEPGELISDDSDRSMDSIMSPSVMVHTESKHYEASSLRTIKEGGKLNSNDSDTNNSKNNNCQEYLKSSVPSKLKHIRADRLRRTEAQLSPIAESNKDVDKQLNDADMNDRISGKLKSFEREWSREDDESLLLLYNQFDGDNDKVVCAFAKSNNLSDLNEIKHRLVFLLSLFN